ncbi:MAG: DUF1573 domain-containing protein [Ginsengibacter sp.]
MKYIFTFLCAVAFLFTTSAQTNVPKGKISKTQTISASSTSTQASVTPVAEASKPTAESISLKETEFDFGKIPQGKPVTHIFEFKNVGATAFALDNVQASCGCTTPEWKKDTIPPGATSKITVGYNAQNEGSFAKPVTITYNGTQTKQIMIKGEVWKTPVTSAPENSAVNSLKNEQ